jgi:hypothetical protein
MWIYRCKPEAHSTTLTVNIFAVKIDFAPSAVPQPMLVGVLYPASTWDQSDADILAGQTIQRQQGCL